MTGHVIFIWVYLENFNQYIYSFRLYSIKVIGLFHFFLPFLTCWQVSLKYVFNSFLLYYRQMIRLNWVSKRELNPSGYFCHISLQREMFIFGQFVIKGDYGLFFGMFFGNCTDSSRCASQVLYKTKTAEKDLQGPPSGNQEEWTLPWDEDLLSLPLVLSMS